jgi:hypothetical protein
LSCNLLLSAPAVSVTLVAIDAVVHIAGNALVVPVGLCLRVTVRTLEDRIIVRIGMAGGAHAACVAVVCREPGVVERGSGPGCGGMAGLAGGGESCRGMVRVRGPVVVRLVAGVAVRGQGGVVVVHVTTGAGHRGVRAGQGKRRVVVVKG